MRRIILPLILLCTAGLLLAATGARPGANDGVATDWPSYGNDPGGMRYVPLDQIRRENVRDLEIAWSYSTGELALIEQHDGVPVSLSATPLVVDGMLYLSTPSGRAIALEAETGREIWTFDPHADREERQFNSSRGVAFWEGEIEGLPGRQRRILYGTVEGLLFSLDARTGRPDPSFAGGYVDLREGEVEEYGFATAPNWGARITSPPAVYRHVVITGWGLPEYPARGPSGDVRAFDIRTGAPVWRFHTVPRPGEYGSDTWDGESWKNRMGANVWTVMSVDPEHGLAFLPTGSATYDYYGGDRKGKNLFANSLVAVDALTGERRWHYQMVHHDLWDMDIAAHPNLITVRRDGRTVPAVAQTTKMGFVFLFHRLTGEPLFPIEHRSVPASEVPGEEAWPEQPFPVKPPPLARMHMTREDLNNLTPEIYDYCRGLFDDAVAGAIFTPVGLKYTITFPGYHGGSNWGGAAFDPVSGTLYTPISNDAAYGRLIEAPEGSPLPYRRGGRFGEFGWFRTPDGIPCQQPPWGELAAVDMNTGDLRWKVPLGIVEELNARGHDRTGTQNLGGPIVTAGGLVFLGGTRDSRFRAFDSDTGAELWTYTLKASAHATPISWMGTSGRQYVAVAESGGGFLWGLSPLRSDRIVVFALPETGRDVIATAGEPAPTTWRRDACAGGPC